MPKNSFVRLSIVEGLPSIEIGEAREALLRVSPRRGAITAIDFMPVLRPDPSLEKSFPLSALGGTDLRHGSLQRVL